MSSPRRYALGRLPPGTMNKTESLYAQRLEDERHVGTIYSWQFEAVKLRLADKTFYTPDFMVHVAETNQIELHEVKGFWEDDARVKIKVAASRFPLFRFLAVTHRKGVWQVEDF